MKTGYLISMAAGLAFIVACAFPFTNLRAADPEKPATYTLQCDMVPAEDVIVQSGEGFKVVGSDPAIRQSFELHALLSWSVPQLDETGRKLTFSGTILNAYLVKTDPVPKTGRSLTQDRSRAASINRGLANPDESGALVYRYDQNSSPRLRIVTTISLDDPQSKQITVGHDIGTGKLSGSKNGFNLEVAANDTDNQHGFTFTVMFDGRFTLGGVQYESNGPFGGNTAIEFSVRVQPGK